MRALARTAALRTSLPPRNLVFGPELTAWAAARIPNMRGDPFPDSATAAGVAIEGKLAGVVVFSDWRPHWRTMQVSAVAEDARWMRARDAWDWMFDYAFLDCDIDKLWSVTPASNRRALKFVWGLGFVKEAVLERHFDTEDAIISRLFADDYYAAREKRKARNG